MANRVTDYALIIGHVWRCNACRDALLENPETTWIGYKLNDDQRTRLAELDTDDLQTVSCFWRPPISPGTNSIKPLTTPRPPAPSGQREG